MYKLFAILSCVLMGCATPHDISLEREKVKEIKVENLKDYSDLLDSHWIKYAQYDGVVWTPLRSDPDLEQPDLYHDGGDSGLFTGYMLASAVFKAKIDGQYEHVIQSLKGMYILTHAAGSGVIARCAFPASFSNLWRYPERWTSRLESGFVGTCEEQLSNTGNKLIDYIRSYPKMVYYTRATRDQLTGILFGLCVAWNELDDTSYSEVVAIRTVIIEIVSNIYHHLKKFDFKIRDNRGKNDTSADDVTDLIKLQLLAIYRKTSEDPDIEEEYQEQFKRSLFLNRFWEFWNIFNNYKQYFAWNLRFARAYSIWVLEDNKENQEAIKEYVNQSLWNFTKEHSNPFFNYIHMAMNGYDKSEAKDALFSLKSLVLRPIRQYKSKLVGDIRAPNIFQVLIGDDAKYHLPPHLRKPTDYFTWEKRGWDVGSGKLVEKPLEDIIGIDFMLPYWMGRHLGFIK